MDAKLLKEILRKHELWITAQGGGEQAKLQGAKLQGADLQEAKLQGAKLQGADLQGAKLQWANLQEANLQEANLQGANLQWANLQEANLQEANLQGAKLQGAKLQWADLSGAKGIATAAEYFSQFDTDPEGVLVYKAVGATHFAAPSQWDIKEGSILTEATNPLRTQQCGCGVGFATLNWIKTEQRRMRQGGGKVWGTDIWLCRIAWIDLADVVVPYNTDGKARCARLQLLRRLEEKEVTDEQE